MRNQPEELTSHPEPADLSTCSMPELRAIRDHYQGVEHGLSYARRIVQGRLDTVAVELERREDGGDEGELIGRLPEALAAHTRAPGLPRPVRELDPPDWADQLLVEVDEILSPGELGRLADIDSPILTAAAARIGEFERQLSALRADVHQRIDRVQDELVGRYRDGASVDDLLT